MNLDLIPAGYQTAHAPALQRLVETSAGGAICRLMDKNGKEEASHCSDRKLAAEWARENPSAPWFGDAKKSRKPRDFL